MAPILNGIPMGKKQQMVILKNGKPVGIWAWWDKNGTITNKNYLQKKQTVLQKDTINTRIK